MVEVGSASIPLPYQQRLCVDCQILIEHGADVNQAKNDEWTPLYMAAHYADAEVVKVSRILTFCPARHKQLTVRSSSTLELTSIMPRVTDGLHCMWQPVTQAPRWSRSAAHTCLEIIDSDCVSTLRSSSSTEQTLPPRPMSIYGRHFISPHTEGTLRL